MGYAIIGAKCSLYFMIISLWGIILLTLVGIFFKIRSPGLFEDLKVDKEWKESNFSLSFILEKYDDCAVNCWIAAGLYVILFIFSLVQLKLNSNEPLGLS